MLGTLPKVPPSPIRPIPTINLPTELSVSYNPMRSIGSRSSRRVGQKSDEFMGTTPKLSTFAALAGFGMAKYALHEDTANIYLTPKLESDAGASREPSPTPSATAQSDVASLLITTVAALKELNSNSSIHFDSTPRMFALALTVFIEPSEQLTGLEDNVVAALVATWRHSRVALTCLTRLNRLILSHSGFRATAMLRLVAAILRYPFPQQLQCILPTYVRSLLPCLLDLKNQLGHQELSTDQCEAFFDVLAALLQLPIPTSLVAATVAVGLAPSSHSSRRWDRQMIELVLSAMSQSDFSTLIDFLMHAAHALVAFAPRVRTDEALGDLLSVGLKFFTDLFAAVSTTGFHLDLVEKLCGLPTVIVPPKVMLSMLQHNRSDSFFICRHLEFLPAFFTSTLLATPSLRKVELLSSITPIYITSFITALTRFISSPNEKLVRNNLVGLSQILTTLVRYGRNEVIDLIQSWRIVELLVSLLVRKESEVVPMPSKDLLCVSHDPHIMNGEQSDECYSDTSFAPLPGLDDLDALSDWDSEWESDSSAGLEPPTPEPIPSFIPALGLALPKQAEPSHSRVNLDEIPCSCCGFCAFAEVHEAILTLLFQILVTDSVTLDPRFVDELDDGRVEIDPLASLAQHFREAPHFTTAVKLLGLFLNNKLRGCAILLRLLCPAFFSPPVHGDLVRIAEGGYGAVYSVVDPPGTFSDIRVALKLQDTKALQSGASLVRIFQEVSTHSLVAQLMTVSATPPPQPNEGPCVGLFDFGLWGTRCVLVMEQCRCSLSQWRQQVQNPKLPLLLHVYRLVVACAEELGRRGVVHYDIKMDNVLIRAPPSVADEKLFDGSQPVPCFDVCLCDFGEALPIRAVLAQDTISRNRGTETLRAPEMLFSTSASAAASHSSFDRRHRPVPGAADVWSIGCLLYEFVTGNFLFDSEDPGDMHARVMGSTPLIPHDARLPGPIKKLLTFILERNHLQRPAMRDVLARVDVAIAAMPTTGSHSALTVRGEAKRVINPEADITEVYPPAIHVSFQPPTLIDPLLVLAGTAPSTRNIGLFNVAKVLTNDTSFPSLVLALRTAQLQEHRVWITIKEELTRDFTILIIAAIRRIRPQYSPAYTHYRFRQLVPLLSPLGKGKHYQAISDLSKSHVDDLVCCCAVIVPDLDLGEPLRCRCTDLETPHVLCCGSELYLESAQWYRTTLKEIMKLTKHIIVTDTETEAGCHLLSCRDCQQPVAYVGKNDVFAIRILSKIP